MHPSSPKPSPYQAAAAQLAAVHRELRGSVASILHHAHGGEAAVASLAEYTTLSSRFLLAHHHVEDTNLFPALRAEGRLRSSDLSVLAGLEKDHRQVHALCERLIEQCRSAAPERGDLHRQVSELQHLLLPHLTAEETALSAERLPHLVSEAALLALQQQAQRGGGTQRQEVLELFEHPLHPRGERPALRAAGLGD